MAKERGWWTLITTVDPDEVDIEHIAEMVRQGFTAGEINKTEEHDNESKNRV